MLLDSSLTPPQTPEREDASIADITPDEDRIPAPNFLPLATPARQLGSLSLATPPSTPPAPLHIRARALLRSTSDSSAVIGRDAERTSILNFINPFIASTSDDSIAAHATTSMYISGSPGTGKTALVSSILASLEVGATRSLYVNCMGLKDISILWERVLSAIDVASASTSKGKTSTSSLHRLEHVLSTSDFKW